jgi:transposase
MPAVWYLKEISDLNKEIRRLKKEKEQMAKELAEEKRRREQAEQELKHIAERKASKKPRFSDYSMRTHEKKMDAAPHKKSTGRRTTLEKIKETQAVKNIYPNGASFHECTYVRSLTVTRLIEGKAVRFLYRLFATKDGGKEARLPDVLPQGEYGIEVAVALAILHYGIEVSIDQACMILTTFCGLCIDKSQANVLLNQLSVLWGKEFDEIKELIALAMIVHIDETGWKIDAKHCYTWIFTTLLHTILLYGQSRKEDVLDAILPRDLFMGIGVTDCLKIYEKRFKRAQKCWAHFLRTAIKLMLDCPQSKEYKAFLKELYAIFKEGRKAQQDNALTDAQREEIALALQTRITALCHRAGEKIPKKAKKEQREFLNLQKRLMRNIDDLFTFVLVPQVEATNNRAERGFRKTAKARNNYQTSKTKKGADRRSVIASVLISLQQNLPIYTLQSITEEVVRWRTEGISLFGRQLQALSLKPSP